MRSRLRRHAFRILALGVVALCALLTRLPSYSAAERAQLAAAFSFERLPLTVGARPQQRMRAVEPSLRTIAAWISAVGAAVSLSDLDGDGLSNDVCLVDPRSNSVTVAPAPDTGDRYRGFLLRVAPLPYDPRTTAPMGCLPGDFNEDGHLDLLVYFWGRTPVFFLRRPNVPFGPSAFVRRELTTSRARWYTDTITSADVDGDGHPDLVVGNYFPDGARVLDADARSDPVMQMQDSMSRATNGGTDRVYLWRSAAKGATPDARYELDAGALTSAVAHGWTLAIGAADLNGDLKPELYFANDFGKDRLLYNESTPGHVRLRTVTGTRGFTTPASKVLGGDSFKGMGIDFGDLNSDGRLDMFVSNITSPYALEESNFAWINTGAKTALRDGRAPFVDRSEPLGLSRSGWSWDAKIADFDDDGVPEILQALGFVRGTVNRWPELQELAMGNDTLLHRQSLWPRFRRGDDLSGEQSLAFFVRGPAERWANLAGSLGLSLPAVGRGIATADVNGDGALDFAAASQWGQSFLFLNHSPRLGRFLALRLLLPPSGERHATRVLDGHAGAVARPAVGAAATVAVPGRPPLVAQVDGGSGHASVRGTELVFGLGRSSPTRVAVRLSWRDGFGRPHRLSLALAPGWHTILLAQGERP
jgi:hypothetical protein